VTGLIAPQPLVTRGVAGVISTSADGSLLIYTNGTNVVIRSVEVRCLCYSCLVVARSLQLVCLMRCFAVVGDPFFPLTCLAQGFFPPTKRVQGPLTAVVPRCYDGTTLSSSFLVIACVCCAYAVQDPSLMTIYTGHTSPVKVAKFSPSGKWVASGDESGKVRVWAWTRADHMLKIEVRFLWWLSCLTCCRDVDCARESCCA
jgi:WD40 repeat protein